MTMIEILLDFAKHDNVKKAMGDIARMSNEEGITFCGFTVGEVMEMAVAQNLIEPRVGDVRAYISTALNNPVTGDLSLCVIERSQLLAIAKELQKIKSENTSLKMFIQGISDQLLRKVE